MFVETPRRIVLGGPLRAPEITMLIDFCDQLHADGHTGLHVDMSAVTDCDRAGLNGLRVLIAATELTTELSGASWGQFAVMLSAAPVAHVPRLRDAVHELLGVAPSPDQVGGSSSGGCWS